MTDIAPRPLPASVRPALPEAARPADLTPAEDPSSRVLEFIQAGKFSPEIAAQLEQALTQSASPAEAAAMGGVDYDMATTAVNMARVGALAVLLVGFVGLSLTLAGLSDSNWVWVVAALLIVVLLVVTSISGLKAQPIKIDVSGAAVPASAPPAPPAPAAGRAPSTPPAS